MQIKILINTKHITLFEIKLIFINLNFDVSEIISTLTFITHFTRNCILNEKPYINSNRFIFLRSNGPRFFPACVSDNPRDKYRMATSECGTTGKRSRRALRRVRETNGLRNISLIITFYSISEYVSEKRYRKLSHSCVCLLYKNSI